MNKRIISALVLAGMMISSAAFASKAREFVLGEGGAEVLTGSGSFYYDSAYNMFYNPSYVNDYKNFIEFEKGAEVGFVTSLMNLNMGLWIDRFGGTQNITGANQSSVLDFLIGGDMGVKWGLGVNYGQQDSISTAGGPGVTNSYMAARLGAQFSGFDPFIGFTAIGDEKTAGTKSRTYKGMNAGFRYHYGEWTPYATFNSTSNKTEPAALETKTTAYVVGLGREAKIAEGARLMYGLYYKRAEVKANSVKISGGYSTVPVNVGVEADALSWLTLRGGATHVLVGNGKTTTGRLGGTFHISKVDVDYAFGNTTGAGSSTTSADTTDVGFDSGTFHKIGLRYSW